MRLPRTVRINVDIFDVVSLNTKESLDRVFFCILIIAACIRLFNLNYNSPFADEAIYIVLGKLGLFQWDWSSYAANNWMAGSLYAYPPLTAIAHATLGIVGSRLMSVILGVLNIITIAQIAQLLSPKKMSRIVLVTTAIIFGFSTTAIALSRLATYDMPSFYFFFQGIINLIKAQQTVKNAGHHYFLSAVFLILAIFFKVIIAAYLPFVLIYAGMTGLKHRLKRHRKYFINYFLMPFVILAGAYLFFQAEALLAFFQSHGVVEKVSVREIIDYSAQHLLFSFSIWIIASIELIFRKKIKFWLVLTMAALWIILVHIFDHRLSTLDKHLFFTQSFISIIGGIGLGFIFQYPKTFVRELKIALVFTTLFFITIFSTKEGLDYGYTWVDTGPVTSYLQSVILPSDYVLSEEGPATMLAIYNKDHPLHVTTFDWYEYQKTEGLIAYANATKDAQFNYILLYRSSDNVSDPIREVQDVVKVNMDKTYQPSYQDNHFIVYKRSY